ncbi:type I restriction endonuclease subunit R [Gulosibacter macacae]|uniref:Type I restriction enzyme endonuclease subunit n=1 Tax=Gulosibacter macacae TaxID=2488791 RepID=A0A3P3VT42_9MICO|nr:type I restriction endonuclease subunit R [Gulosibacter macacae]RRJ85624.1 type I restriction endonuclease subunit R [Gulosibacter macacae]
MTDATPRHFDPVALSSESTVVAEYTPPASTDQGYQSEAALEREFISILESQAYERLHITSEAQLVANLRTQLERLNKTTFSDDEWQRLFEQSIASKNEGIVEKTARIQEAPIVLLKRDDDTSKNITLLDKENIHNNRLQVINQYETNRADASDPTSPGGTYANRYDVTVLVNGLPMVHIELKRRGIDIREAFNQINRYQRDSFWSGSGLFDYVQLFVISNGTLTKYYSNTTRSEHLKESGSAGASIATRSRRTTSNSYEFTSWWADALNRPIQDLTSFARTFFAKHSLLNILTRYCVFTVDRKLMVMRPYQIVATERILQRITIATNARQLGTVAAGGYVWHTTGSGKTLTSFKTAQLATKLESVDKVLFVVDRKDLDYQTMREYDRFEKGAANSNNSTAALKRQLEDSGAKIIITTIQKLSNFIAQNKGHQIYSGHVVLIFDECHRSQFGDMHRAITRAFKRYHLFGFTGTPIFAANSGGGRPELKTTEQAFGDKLHTYTIVDAITDKNVLPFRIDYVNTVRVGNVADKQVSGIDSEQALLAPERIREIVGYTLEHFDQKTKRASTYEHHVVTNVVAATRTRGQQEAIRAKKRVRGFNAIFATASIDAARRYYNAFQLQQEELPPAKRLRIGIIYSYGANDAVDDGLLDDEAFDTDALSVDARTFLESAIQDYNEMFGTSYDTSSDRFQNYYKDLSQRLKNRELDLVIVVNMFLTGFDATTLNTLFVDKNLRAHGLIQAYSRTNRILNSVKTYGNIVSFRNLEDETNAALELFGNKDARGIVVLKPYLDYYNEYAAVVAELRESFSPTEMPVGEGAQKKFIALFGQLLRLENILTSFDDFAGSELISARDHADFQSRYLELQREFRQLAESDREGITDDVVFEIELIKQVEINVDYILMLVEKYRSERGDGDDREVRAEISRAVSSSPTLRNKKDLIENFVDGVSLTAPVDHAWMQFVVEQRDAELDAIIAEERLQPEETREFIGRAFREGLVRTTGTAITRIMPRVSRFASKGGHGETKARVLDRLQTHFERFAGLLASDD